MGYNYQIVIQQRTDARDDYGEMDATWSTYKTVWAEMEVDGGHLGYESEQPVYSDMRVFRIHTYDAPDVTTKMRFTFDGGTYSIRSISKEGRFHTVLIAEDFDDE